jgi:hypothetical protein
MAPKQMAHRDERLDLTLREYAQITVGTLFFLLIFLAIGFVVALGPAQ